MADFKILSVYRLPVPAQERNGRCVAFVEAFLPSVGVTLRDLRLITEKPGVYSLRPYAGRKRGLPSLQIGHELLRAMTRAAIDALPTAPLYVDDEAEAA